MNLKNGFKKKERLTGKKNFDLLFNQGAAIYVFPFKVYFNLKNAYSGYDVKVAFAIPGKKIKKAVRRNRVRRLCKESYRKQKAGLHDYCSRERRSIDMIFIYTPVYIAERDTIEKSVELILNQIQSRIENE